MLPSPIRQGQRSKLFDGAYAAHAVVVGIGRGSAVLAALVVVAYHVVKSWRMLLAASSIPPLVHPEDAFVMGLPSYASAINSGSLLSSFALVRSCESPEYGVPFPYAPRYGISNLFGELDPQQDDRMVGKSQSSPTTCTIGQQNEFTSYMHQVSQEIQLLIGSECKEFLRYGASFGSFRKSRKFITKMQFPTKSKCSLLLMIDDEIRNARPFVHSDGRTSSVLLHAINDPTALRVNISRHVLPFQNMRRNVKLFKMHGPIIFPWAERILWMDAKLNRAGPMQQFRRYFEATVEQKHVCVSFVSAPIHESVIGSYIPANATLPTFEAHCKTLLDSFEDRPDLSDSAGIITRQCLHYNSQYARAVSESPGSPPLSLDAGMIDSALIGWDLRSERCRQFNADLGCTWGDEIHCYADRDQISFPYSLMKMDLVPQGQQGIDDTRTKSIVLNTRASGDPAVSMVKSQCHWYDQPVVDCILEEQETMEAERLKLALPQSSSVRRMVDRTGCETSPAGCHGKRVAVFISGSMQRFQLASAREHLVQALRNQGHSADFYISLTTATANVSLPSTIPDEKSSYLSKIHPDALFKYVAAGDDGDTSHFQEFLTRSVENHGGIVKALAVQERLDIDSDIYLTAHREEMKREHSEENPDIRFPVLNLLATSDMVSHNQDLLRHYFAIQNLWDASKFKEKSGHFKYDYYLFLPADSYWLDDFNLDGLLSSESADLYIHSCGVAQLPLHESEIESYPILATPQAADLFGNFYSYLFEMNLGSCADILAKKKGTNARMTGCTNAMIYEWSRKSTGYTTAYVNRSLFPVERALNVADSAFDGVCLLSFCPRTGSRAVSRKLLGMPPCRALSTVSSQMPLKPPRPECMESPFSGCSAKKVVGVSRLSTTTCGLCDQNQFAKFVKYVSSQIRKWKQSECRAFAQYSVKFTKSYSSEWDISSFYGDDDAAKCTFVFVIKEDMKNFKNFRRGTQNFLLDNLSDNSALLIPVPRSILPYREISRNIKLFQLHGHQLFPWVDRLVYTDSNFRRGVNSTVFSTFFKRTIEDNALCMALVAAPTFDSDLGYLSRRAIQIGTDPDDDISQMLSLTDVHDGIIDSGLIMWNLQSDRCRKFNADVACTWGNEMRKSFAEDKFGFTYSFGRMGLSRVGPTTGYHQNISSVWSDSTDDSPAVAVVSSRCHWYLSPTLDCFGYDAPSTDSHEPMASKCLTCGGKGNDTAISIPQITTVTSYGRVCASSEFEVPFPFYRCPVDYDGDGLLIAPLIASSFLTSRTCGICQQNKFARFLEKASHQLKEGRLEECKSILTFSIDFDSAWQKSPRYIPKESRAGSCMVIFTLDENVGSSPSSMNDASLLRNVSETKPDARSIIPVPRSVLPYRSMRRNALLFKLQANQFFTWVDQLVYLDISIHPLVLGSKIAEHFFRPPGEENSCSHYFAAQMPERYGRINVPWPNFWLNCEDLVFSLGKTTLLDDVEALSVQCSNYLNMTTSDEEDQGSIKTSPFDKALIDSRLIIWDLRSERCRQFNADFLCTWQEENHCNSDREDVSFPYVLQRMGLKNEDDDPMRHNLTWYDPVSLDPVVRVMKTSCTARQSQFSLSCFI